MPWLFVGRRRKLMVYDHQLPAYVAFWQRTTDKARRLCHEPPTPAERAALGGLPNFDLFCTLEPDSPTALLMAFAFAPFALSLGLLEQAEAEVGPRAPVWTMPDAPDVPEYRALVLRLTYLGHLIEVLRANQTINADVSAELERKVVLWRNGHIMLTLALEELGYVPTDAGTWRTLLEHFAPDINMFFHEGEMPDAMEELDGTPILKKPPPAQSAQNKVRAANAICLAFTKVCPRRCGMRDLVEILLEYALRNVTTLHFVMLVMAAAYLGVYAHCKRQPDFAMTRDCYKLFFFQLPVALTPLRRSAQTEAERLKELFRIDPDDVHIYVTRGAPRVLFSDYEAAIREQYRAAGSKAEKAAAEVKVKTKKADGRGRRPETIVPTMATTREVPTIQVDDDEVELRNAIALTNATARLELDRQLGIDYYERRVADGTLPTLGDKPQEFITPDMVITDVYAYRHVVEEDRQMPSAVDMARRGIVYRALSTLIEYDNQRVAESGRQTPPSKDYPCTGTLTQQLREFMFALLARNRPLLDEISARVEQWHAWQASVIGISDHLRTRLSDAYVDGSGVPFLRRYRVHYLVGADPASPTNNLFSTENPPFVGPLFKHMTTTLQSPRFLTQTVDRVVPREYGIVMAALFAFWEYPHTYAESSVEPEFDDLASTTMTEDPTVETTTVPFFEAVVPAMRPFAITLTKDTPPPDASEAWIKEHFVRRLLFPGKLFHMTSATIDAFNRTLMAYSCRDDDQEKLLTSFVNSLVATSVFQFMLVYTFVRTVDAYLSVKVVPLPRHIVEQQLRVMCQRTGCTDPADIPRHTHYSLVCLSCRRFAGFLATPRRPNMRFADGTNDVRTRLQADDQIVLERVRQRGRLLAPDELTSAESMHDVFDERAMHATTPYDKFTADPIDGQLDAERRASGYYDAVLPYDPWQDDTMAAKRELVVRLFRQAAEYEATVELRDWRLTDPIYALGDQPVGTPLPPLRPVAVDGTIASELAFNRRVRDVYDRLMGGRYLLMGHRIPTADNRPYTAATDSRRKIRQELKKRKAGANKRAEIALIVSSTERKKEADKLERKTCRDVTTLAECVHCSTQLLWQFERIGNALIIAPRGRTQKTVDIIFDCCGCGTSVQFSMATTRGAWWFCSTCMSDGTWSIWVNGSSTLNMPAPHMAPRDVEMPLASRFMSPGRTWMPDECVRHGERCVYPKCRRYKMPGTQMVLREIAFDAYGKEHMGYVAVCAMHQRIYAWIFTLPFVLTHSMISVLLHDGKTNVSFEELRDTDFLMTHMTRLADVSRTKTRKRTLETED